MTRKTIRELLLVDDHVAVREGLKHLVEASVGGLPDMKVVAEAADGEQAIALAARHQPDLVLMDINMPTLNGGDATTHIKKACLILP